MPHAVTGYNEFFDEVASVMREKSEELASYV